jgi:hypothetical protein
MVLPGGADESPFETANMFESEIGYVGRYVVFFEELIKSIGGGLFFFLHVPVAGGASLVVAGGANRDPGGYIISSVGLRGVLSHVAHRC